MKNDFLMARVDDSAVDCKPQFDVIDDLMLRSICIVLCVHVSRTSFFPITILHFEA
jgi:hypothetical protein